MSEYGSFLLEMYYYEGLHNTCRSKEVLTALDLDKFPSQFIRKISLQGDNYTAEGITVSTLTLRTVGSTSMYQFSH